ncbi:MAG: hypothetical protein IKB35_00520, partial [Clostridia bacterium]|nr:hypothetical protein [Clostridia bacterium]
MMCPIFYLVKWFAKADYTELRTTTKQIQDIQKLLPSFSRKAEMCPIFYLVKWFAKADYTELRTTTKQIQDIQKLLPSFSRKAEM